MDYFRGEIPHAAAQIGLSENQEFRSACGWQLVGFPRGAGDSVQGVDGRGRLARLSRRFQLPRDVFRPQP